MPADKQADSPARRGTISGFDLERFKYEVAAELGLNPDLRKNDPAVRRFEQQTHSNNQGGGVPDRG